MYTWVYPTVASVADGCVGGGEGAENPQSSRKTRQMVISTFPRSCGFHLLGLSALQIFRLVLAVFPRVVCVYDSLSQGSYRIGSCEWTLGNGQCQAWRDGRGSSQSRACDNVCELGESVELSWNCTASKLLLVFPNGQKVYMFLPKLAKWRLHVGLIKTNDKIRIVSL